MELRNYVKVERLMELKADIEGKAEQQGLITLNNELETI